MGHVEEIPAELHGPPEPTKGPTVAHMAETDRQLIEKVRTTLVAILMFGRKTTWCEADKVHWEILTGYEEVSIRVLLQLSGEALSWIEARLSDLIPRPMGPLPEESTSSEDF